MGRLRASDSGRVVGPKAANLGELKYRFPETVAEGLAIPFGHFRTLLDQALEPDGPSAFHWMQTRYAQIRDLAADPQRRDEAVRRLLRRMHDWILQADAGRDFRERLRAAMEQAFGPDGTYGVFVRSDTNAEDLPGFTGAGLNLTVPNVVGFENVLQAISRVWASPFTERAYRWRQANMDQPEHIYVSVLLMKSVPVEKSGVMVTADIESGRAGWLSIAVNEGVGGAVADQKAEELRINMQDGPERLLDPEEIARLIEFARRLPESFPELRDDHGRPVPADIEFGFYQKRLALFQIRPFLESIRARQNLFLNRLDQNLDAAYARTVALEVVPGEETP
ncbi:MAG: hypothetical protein JSW39_15495 [Desulfobacterales bacterium]|nr:MAG: hypothetical protein JSW39_15495 [Desulfobacterales bacterium]